MQCQGICEDKENNHELSGAESSDFSFLFSAILELSPISGCLSCMGELGKEGWQEKQTSGNGRVLLLHCHGHSCPQHGGVDRPDLFSLQSIWPEIPA